jgi:protein-disulfide isomerase
VLDKHPQDIKLVYKNFPLSNHKFARKAAAAALSAHNQGKFSAFHGRLFENYQSLDDAKIEEIAQELSLNMEEFNQDRTDAGIQQLIIRDMREGQRAGVRGTPTLFINGKRVTNRSLEDIEAAINAELEKKE